MKNISRLVCRHVAILSLALMLMACSSTMTNAKTLSSSVNPSIASATTAPSYPIVDTGQTHCYNNNQQISCPRNGAAFFGQDAQYQGNQPSYTLSADGLTVRDNVTGLTWQRSPDTNGDGSVTYSDKLTYTQAQALPAKLNAAKFGGYNDWRLPTIKELYSLIDFNGTDPNPTSTDTSDLKPFINTNYFVFSYGFTGNGERIIDSQWATSTTYVANSTMMFGVNFADGRIKGYPLSESIGKKYFAIGVRGNTNYGVNSFVNNGDGTITDNATSLMWSQPDSGKGMNWESALAWVQQKNAEKYLGYNDWRLPSAKELQSIVDYARSPDTTNSAAIDPVFSVTAITNEAGKSDYPYYWTGTTHGLGAPPAGLPGEGVYVAFGRALGNMQGGPQGSGWVDVHGAGAQRSDPKHGNPANYATGRGPQGDAIRINNYVRLVRGGNVTFTTNTAAPSGATGQQPGQGQPPMSGQQPQPGQGQGQQSRPGQNAPPGQTPPSRQQPSQGQPPANQNAQPGDRTGGRVTAISGSTISVENLEGKATIVTNASTQFTSNGQTSKLANVTIGKFIEVVGQKQADGTWVASQITIADRPPMPPGQGQSPTNR